jgi:hypothetical protein
MNIQMLARTGGALLGIIPRNPLVLAPVHPPGPRDRYNGDADQQEQGDEPAGHVALRIDVERRRHHRAPRRERGTAEHVERGTRQTRTAGLLTRQGALR